MTPGVDGSDGTTMIQLLPDCDFQQQLKRAANELNEDRKQALSQ